MSEKENTGKKKKIEEKKKEKKEKEEKKKKRKKREYWETRLERPVGPWHEGYSGELRFMSW